MDVEQALGPRSRNVSPNGCAYPHLHYAKLGSEIQGDGFVDQQKLYIFLDETGKTSNEVSMIGAISMPTEYYTSLTIQKFNVRLQAKKFKMHFSNYNKRDYELYREVIALFTQVPGQLNLNIILFKKSMYKQKQLLKGQLEDMVYEELPERVIYGLFRDSSNFTEVTAKVFIEASQEYYERNLARKLKNQLNTHFLYRFNNYRIETSALVPKNRQIGVELTDCLLGICSLIIKNNALIDGQGELSKNLLAKTLLAIDLLPDLQEIFNRTTVFELCAEESLVARTFDTYLRPFQARINEFRQQHPEYFDDSYKRVVRK